MACNSPLKTHAPLEVGRCAVQQLARAPTWYDAAHYMSAVSTFMPHALRRKLKLQLNITAA